MIEDHSSTKTGSYHHNTVLGWCHRFLLDGDFHRSLVDLQESHCFCRLLGGDLTVAVVARFVASVLDVSAAGAQEESAAACTVSAVTQSGGAGRGSADSVQCCSVAVYPVVNS